MINNFADKKFVITREPDESSDAIEKLRQLGSDVLFFPSIKIVPVSDYSLFDSKIRNQKYDFVIFTSGNAVDYFYSRLSEIEYNFDVEAKIAAVGSKTADTLLSKGTAADILPERFSSTGLLEYFKDRKLSGRRILIPGSAISRTELKIGLRRMGAEVDFVPVYDVIMPDRNEVIVPINKINKEKFDMFMFTSPSAYKNFICLMDIGKPRDFFSQTKVAAIGPTTQNAILKSGIAVDVVPEIYTIEKMIEGVINFYERNT